MSTKVEIGLLILDCILDFFITFFSCITTAMLATKTLETPNKAVVLFAGASGALMAMRTAKQIVAATLKGYKNAEALVNGKNE